MPKVVSFTPKPEEPPLTLVDRDYRECRHVRFDVDREQPLVFCRDCDAALDPVFVLRRIASAHAERHYGVQDMKREAERLEKQARRSIQTRRNPSLAERDAANIQRYAAIQRRPADDFPGDVGLTDRPAAEPAE